jgi:WxcM-like protein
MPPVRGVRLVHLDRISDARGSLLPFGSTPFDVKNVFFIRDCPPDAIRAEHATSCEEVIVALSSTVTIDLDNGTEQELLRLTSPEEALVIAPGVWVRLREFTEDTALVVLSSEAHAEVERFDRPNPALLDHAER